MADDTPMAWAKARPGKEGRRERGQQGGAERGPGPLTSPKEGPRQSFVFPQASLPCRPPWALPARTRAQAGEDITVATHLQLGFLETTKALGVLSSHDCLK